MEKVSRKLSLKWLHDLWSDMPPRTRLARKVVQRKNKKRQMKKMSRRKNRRRW